MLFQVRQSSVLFAECGVDNGYPIIQHIFGLFNFSPLLYYFFWFAAAAPVFA